jgi:hypothetical protein
MTQVFTPHYLCDRDFLLWTGYKTQKREAGRGPATRKNPQNARGGAPPRLSLLGLIS